MYNNNKKYEVSKAKQKEDKYLRFDYDKVLIDFPSMIRGNKTNIEDSR
jgi:hypothetical protein